MKNWGDDDRMITVSYERLHTPKCIYKFPHNQNRAMRFWICRLEHWLGTQYNPEKVQFT